MKKRVPTYTIVLHVRVYTLAFLFCLKQTKIDNHEFVLDISVKIAKLHFSYLSVEIYLTELQGAGIYTSKARSCQRNIGAIESRLSKLRRINCKGEEVYSRGKKRLWWRGRGRRVCHCSLCHMWIWRSNANSYTPYGKMLQQSRGSNFVCLTLQNTNWRWKNVLRLLQFKGRNLL